MTVRTRFAPSPTGYLHVGSARTALYSWLYARKKNGKFILRIEDTDHERSTQESVQAILDGMSWLKLNYEEGPFYQTQRMEHYRAGVQKLLSEKKAYRCNCSKERLEKLRNEQMAKKEKPRYDGFCRNKTDIQGECVIRFKNPNEGSVEFDDLIRGKLTFNNNELDDLIIARSDGSPTYNFTVVIDDLEMKVTHVIRGDDHINNTPRQINILKALNAAPPLYAHIPMILGEDGKRLSKRHGAVSVLQFKEEGILPESLLNYLVRLGWSHGDQEIFSIEEMIKLFEIHHIHKAPAAFNMEKLLWLNQHYIKTLDPAYVVEAFAWQLQHCNINYENGPDIMQVFYLQRERAKTLKEMAEKSRYFYETVSYNEASIAKHVSGDLIPVLENILAELTKLSEWTKDHLHQILLQVAEKTGLKLGKIAQPIRIGVTGDTISPSIDETLFVLGRELVTQRLIAFLSHIKNRQIVS